MEQSSQARVRSALFIDFDNIFSGLLALDRAAAEAFANEPGRWLDRLGTAELAPGWRRDFLVRRAYLNPSGWVPDAAWGNEAGRLYLQRFRPNLTRAGFEVVDCPALTSRQKNAADIRMVIDVLDVLDARAHYDEILLASSDADFTPLLQRVRADDRRTGIITAGPVAPAYRSVADWCLDEEELISLLADPRADGPVPVDLDGAADAEGPPSEVAGDVDVDGIREEAAALARQLIADRPEATYLAQLGLALRERFGAEITSSSWFGYRTLGGFVRSLGPGLTVDELFVWDPQVHPDPGSNGPDAPGLPAPVLDVCRATDLPRLDAGTWPAVFEVLEEYLALHVFNLTEITAWSRDRLAERSLPVGRTALGFVVRAVTWSGVSMRSTPPPTAVVMRDAVVAVTLDRAQAAGLSLAESDVGVFTRWLAGEEPTG